jgi:hypothetical protein
MRGLVPRIGVLFMMWKTWIAGKAGDDVDDVHHAGICGVSTLSWGKS